MKTKRLPAPDPRFTVTDRQERVPGFSQEALYSASVFLVGAGGIGSEIAEGLVRKGAGTIMACDPDCVDFTNLNRSLFFTKDLYRPKAFALVKNLAPHATCGTTLIGYALSFQDTVALKLHLTGSVVICGVDNGETRVAVSDHYRKLGIPVIFVAVDRVAEAGHVFVQEPARACFGCAFPDALNAPPAPCRTPAVKDTLKIMAGLALYAVDSLLMERKRNWNYRRLHLGGFVESPQSWVERNPQCPLCHD
jgi:molybdopterin-synthase adenylyltransferase